MDNKYGLGSTKVANEHHDAHRKFPENTLLRCKFCHQANLVLSQTLHDHCCADCGKWQNDIPIGYSTGRFSDY